MAHLVVDPFVDSDGNPRLLRGIAIQSNAARVAELAGMLGFETVWIDVEHGPTSWTEVEYLCMGAEAGGCVPTVRVPSNQRSHILRSLEAGAHILVVPMIDNAEQAQQIVEYGKFPPLGRRGFNIRSRGLQYGLTQSGSHLQDANERTQLFAQIESLEAVKNAQEICQVEGLAGIVIGPGDLSSDMGRPGAFTDPEVIATVESVVRIARSLGKHAGVVVSPGPMLDAAIAAGCDLAYCSSDLGCMMSHSKQLLEEVPNTPMN